ncbi:MAG TPA: PASTA domain-containing protein [Acidimicrobiales bacterium]|nr:PASTA domain-containing protein [Acidimicrobiales bacterium]
MALVAASLAFIAGGVALWRTVDAPLNSNAPENTVPAGPPLVTVPSVINRSGLVAAGQLAALKLNVTVITGPSVTTGRDHVITQDPLPGTRVPEGSSVQLKLSSGPV